MVLPIGHGQWNTSTMAMTCSDSCTHSEVIQNFSLKNILPFVWEGGLPLFIDFKKQLLEGGSPLFEDFEKQYYEEKLSSRCSYRLYKCNNFLLKKQQSSRRSIKMINIIKDNKLFRIRCTFNQMFPMTLTYTKIIKYFLFHY